MKGTIICDTVEKQGMFQTEVFTADAISNQAEKIEGLNIGLLHLDMFDKPTQNLMKDYGLDSVGKITSVIHEDDSIIIDDYEFTDDRIAYMYDNRKLTSVSIAYRADEYTFDAESNTITITDFTIKSVDFVPYGKCPRCTVQYSNNDSSEPKIHNITRVIPLKFDDVESDSDKSFTEDLSTENVDESNVITESISKGNNIIDNVIVDNNVELDNMSTQDEMKREIEETEKANNSVSNDDILISDLKSQIDSLEDKNKELTTLFKKTIGDNELSMTDIIQQAKQEMQKELLAETFVDSLVRQGIVLAKNVDTHYAQAKVDLTAYKNLMKDLNPVVDLGVVSRNVIEEQTEQDTKARVNNMWKEHMTAVEDQIQHSVPFKDAEVAIPKED